MELFFFLCELVIYICIIIFDYLWVKYLGIIVCFLYALYIRKGYFILLIIVVADYFLLFTHLYVIGIVFFIIVQCLYHRMLSKSLFFYLPLILSFDLSIYSVGLCYALLSVFNIIDAICKKHWLTITLVLLAICDIGVLIQFLYKTNIYFIWVFYLPSQIYYIKMISSSEDETIVKAN